MKVEVGERERVPTVTERHKGGNWLERERGERKEKGERKKKRGRKGRKEERKKGRKKKEELSEQREPC